jgi:hypothetical protein
VVVLVIDSREVSQKHPLLAFVHLASSDPFLTQQRSKLDNEDDDEYRLESRGLFWVRHEHFVGSRTFVACGLVARREQARWMAWQLWPFSFLV